MFEIPPSFGIGHATIPKKTPITTKPTLTHALKKASAEFFAAVERDGVRESVFRGELLMNMLLHAPHIFDIVAQAALPSSCEPWRQDFEAYAGEGFVAVVHSRNRFDPENDREVTLYPSPVKGLLDIPEKIRAAFLSHSIPIADETSKTETPFHAKISKNGSNLHLKILSDTGAVVFEKSLSLLSQREVEIFRATTFGEGFPSSSEGRPRGWCPREETEDPSQKALEEYSRITSALASSQLSLLKNLYDSSYPSSEQDLDWPALENDFRNASVSGDLSLMLRWAADKLSEAGGEIFDPQSPFIREGNDFYKTHAAMAFFWSALIYSKLDRPHSAVRAMKRADSLTIEGDTKIGPFLKGAMPVRDARRERCGPSDPSLAMYHIHFGNIADENEAPSTNMRSGFRGRFDNDPARRAKNRRSSGSAYIVKKVASMINAFGRISRGEDWVTPESLTESLDDEQPLSICFKLTVRDEAEKKALLKKIEIEARLDTVDQPYEAKEGGNVYSFKIPETIEIKEERGLDGKIMVWIQTHSDPSYEAYQAFRKPLAESASPSIHRGPLTLAAIAGASDPKDVKIIAKILDRALFHSAPRAGFKKLQAQGVLTYVEDRGGGGDLGDNIREHKPDVFVFVSHGVMGKTGGGRRWVTSDSDRFADGEMIRLQGPLSEHGIRVVAHLPEVKKPQSRAEAFMVGGIPNESDAPYTNVSPMELGALLDQHQGDHPIKMVVSDACHGAPNIALLMLARPEIRVGVGFTRLVWADIAEFFNDRFLTRITRGEDIEEAFHATLEDMKKHEFKEYPNTPPNPERVQEAIESARLFIRDGKTAHQQEIETQDLGRRDLYDDRSVYEEEEALYAAEDPHSFFEVGLE